MDPISALLNIGSTIIDKLFPDPVKRDEAKLQLAKLQQDGELKALETRMSAIIAEAKSTDKWTSRARPSFLYVIYIMILSALPMGVLFAFEPAVAHNIAEGMQAWLKAIPEPLYALFGAGYLGYSASRSYDKKNLNATR